MAFAALAGAGAGIALYDFLTSKGQTLTITDNIMTNMAINSVTNINTECFNSIDAKQSISITSLDNPDFKSTDPDPCTFCLQKLKEIYDARVQLEQDALGANPNYVVQAANSFLENQMLTGGSFQVNDSQGLDPVPPTNTSKTLPSLGPCTGMCSDVVASNIFQNQSFIAKQDCNVDNSVADNIQQDVSSQITAFLKNQEDVFGQLSNAFTSNTSSISNNLSTSMVQNITNNFTNTLHQEVKNNQTINITGNSILTFNVSQSYTATQVGVLNVTNTVVDQLRQSADYSIAQHLINKNDTIGDISKDFLRVITSMGDLVDTLTTQLLIIVGALLTGVILITGVLYVFNKDFRLWFKVKVKNRREFSNLDKEKMNSALYQRNDSVEYQNSNNNDVSNFQQQPNLNYSIFQ